MKECVTCATQIPANSGFCSSCGAPQNGSEVTDSQQAETKASIRKPKTGLVAALVIGGVLVVGAAITLLLPDSRFSSAVSECDLDTGVYVLADDGQGLYLGGHGEESWGMSYGDISCVIDFLDVPMSVQTRMENTNSLMGIQEASFNGIKVQWFYHPNYGFDLYFEIEE